MRSVLFFSLLAVVFSFYSCSDSDEQSPRLNVILVDSPGDYQEVNIEVLEVSINYSNEDDEGGWETLETEAGIYDLLELTGGNEQLLVSSDVPGVELAR